ncbi:MAG TPA: ATP synthase subunit I [Polyangiaceae bacterium]|nr:ATP synthase subunit I [Polyangiaceae bacterium]
MKDPPGARGGALDARLRACLAAVVACGAAMSLAAVLVVGPRAGFSVGVGSALAAANLWLLARIVAALLAAARADDGAAPRAGQAGRAWLWALAAVLKMFGLLALVWLLMRYELVSTLGMVVGFGALPVGIAIGALVGDRASRQQNG